MLPSEERSTSSDPQPVNSSKEDPCCWLSTAAAAASEEWVLPRRIFHFPFLLPKSLRALSNLKKKKKCIQKKAARSGDNLAEGLGDKARKQTVNAGIFPDALGSCYTLISCDRHKDGQTFAYKASCFIHRYSHWEAQENVSSPCLCRARLNSRDAEEGKPRIQIKSLQRLLIQLSMQKHTHVSCTKAKGRRSQCVSEHLAQNAWVFPK